MNMTNDNPQDTLEIDVNAIPLDELIIAIGGVLFSGTELQEIDTILLEKLIDAAPEADKEPACAENDTKDPANADKPTLVNLFILITPFYC